MRHFLLLLLFFSFSFSPKAQNNVRLAVQRGHYSSLRAVEFHPVKPIIFTSANDGLIKLWNRHNGREILSLMHHQGPVRAMEVSTDGKILASGDVYGNLAIWNTGDLQPFYSKKIVDGSITSLSFLPEVTQLLVSGRDRKAFLYDYLADSVVVEWQVDPGQYGSDIVLSANSQWLAIGNDNGKVFLIDRRDGTIDTLRNIKPSFCGGCVAKVAFGDRNKTLLTGARDGHLTLWNISSGNKKAELMFLEEAPVALGLSEKNNLAFVATEDSVFVINTQNSRKIISWKPHDKAIRNASMSADGNFLLTAGNDETAVLWEIATAKRIQTYEGWIKKDLAGGLDLDPDEYWESFQFQLLSLKHQVAISPDSKRLCRGWTGSDINLWDMQNGRWRSKLSHHEKAVLSMKFSKDGNYLLSGGADRKAILWDMSTQKPLHIWDQHQNYVLDVAFSNDESRVATASYDGYIRLFDVKSGDLIKIFSIEKDQQYFEAPYTIQFTPNDLYLIVGTTSNKLQLWELDSGLPYREIIGHTDLTGSIAVEPGSSRIFSGSWDGTVREWDIVSGYQFRKYSGHTGKVNDVDLAQQHPWLLTASSDRTAIIWDRKKGEPIHTLSGHQNVITAAHFLKNDSLALTYTIDGEMKVWDTATGSLLFTQYYIGSSDWLSVVPSGFFYATEKAKENIFFVKGFESYRLEQFFDKFYQPDVVPKALQGNYRINGSDLYRQIEQNPLPEINFLNPKSNIAFKNRELDVMWKVTNTGGGIKEVVIKQNGKRLKPTEQFDFSKVKKGKSVVLNESITLVPGFNQLEISAINSANLESDIKKLSVNYEKEGNKPDCYLLAIGINEYENDALNLNYARKDASEFVKKIRKNKGTIFNEVETLTLYDRQATRKNILDYLEFVINQAQPNDVFIMYYAGHGSLIENDFHIIPTECTRLYDDITVREQAISADYLQQQLTKIGALKQIIILDACQSGAGAALLAVRGGIEEKAIAQLSRSAGVHVLASSGSEQFAAEFDQLGHGLFTYILLKAMDGEADGSPEDGKVTVYEIKSFLDALVPELSKSLKGNAQYPFTFSKGSDFPLIVK